MLQDDLAAEMKWLQEVMNRPIHTGQKHMQ